MSKTYRRQGIESKIAINGSECNPKIAGVYTEYDFADSYSWERIYRLPTNYEAYRKFRKFHLDAGTAEFRQGSMKAWMRRIEQKKHRSVHRMKITQFLKGINDDVVQEELPKFPSCWW